MSAPRHEGTVTPAGLTLVEDVVSRFPGVREAAAKLVDDISGDRRAVVWIEADSKTPVDQRDLRRFLRERLPRASMPGRLVPIGALPRDRDGNVDRARLVAPSWISASVHSLRLLPDPVESRLAELWSDLLGVPDIEVDEDFFDLGGSSRGAMQLLARCTAEFDTTVAIHRFFEQPTVEGLARLVKGDSPAHSCLLTVGSHGTKRPFFCVYPGTGVQGLRLLSRFEPDRPFVTITPHGFGETAPEVRDLSELASHYLGEIRAVQPHGPYHLGGHCASAIVAYEIGTQLAGQGETVATFVGVKAAARVDLSRVRGPDFFVLDELFGNAGAGSAAKRIEALLDAELDGLRSAERQPATIARMRPALADLHRELMSTAAMSADYEFDRFMALIESWAWYVTAAAGHAPTAAAFPVDIVTQASDPGRVRDDWLRVAGREPVIHRTDSIEPFESPDFAEWLVALLDGRDAELAAGA